MNSPFRQFALVRYIRDQRELARALDRHLQLSLVQSARARDPQRLNLAALGQERRQQTHVLVIDVVDLLRAELADSATSEESSTGRVSGSLAFLLVAAAAAAASSFFPHRWASKPSMSS